MKYRVKIAHSYHQNFGHLYEVERKESGWLSSWEHVGLADSEEEADSMMRKDMKKQKALTAKKLPASGTVVKEFDESDLIVEKLQGR
jgi:hypothetical protein